MNGRFWTDEEDALLRNTIPSNKMTARQVADRLGRTVTMVYGRMHKIGVRSGLYKRWAPALIGRIRALHAKELSDREIGERVGIPRRSVNLVRLRLKLPINEEGSRRGRLLAVANQMKSLGIRHGGDLRAYGFRRYARENGWPEDLRPREVQILNALAVHGPQTNVELADRIGANANKTYRTGNRRLLLAGNGPGGTYTATLMRRGLVMRQKRYVTGQTKRGPKGRQITSLYMLTAAAVAMIEERTKRVESQSQTA